ncbi:hypothetical protein NDU88_005028 [Pleurodeles waltl]|uniref:Uncharacterized protein n=1 Tax=Pleurodeles waltl TaxID=8319 RepID=A0AAV7TSX5_PLEWA|nr:hypothetical protein NDU88_005028 [Pleurodeles waltl]
MWPGGGRDRQEKDAVAPRAQERAAASGLYVASPQAQTRVDENHETPENIPKRHGSTRGCSSEAVNVDIVTSIERDGPWKCR